MLLVVLLPNNKMLMLLLSKLMLLLKRELMFWKTRKSLWGEDAPPDAASGDGAEDHDVLENDGRACCSNSLCSREYVRYG